MKANDENLEFKKFAKIRKARKWTIFGYTSLSIGLLYSSIIFFINKKYILGYIFSILFGLMLIAIVYNIVYFNKILRNKNLQ
ncbi:hypothetical protein [Ferroplasma sp. Type II]|uniref:hypothetical protein n=1 Tax=Ferroplasma sp. Type II TaxID=261388 RepID=UPI0025BD415F|nr:hypothetical protein [Ferroplasma sp. Type II]